MVFVTFFFSCYILIILEKNLLLEEKLHEEYGDFGSHARGEEGIGIKANTMAFQS
jgi:hypothetical protein